MPFPIPLSSPQETTLRTSGYWSRNLVALCPNEVVFRARAAESITEDPFITFEYDSVDIGSFGDVWEGMVCFISATTSLRDAKYRGRVRLAPSSSEFYIDQNATILNEDDYIIVVRDTDLFACIRNDALIDGSITYHPLPPTTNGLPFAIVLYDADDDGVCEYTSVQVGIPVDAEATAVDTWAWDISGSGASSIDDAALQNPTFTFEAGYHYLVRVIYEDDNGTSNYQITHVYAVTRTFDAPVVQPIVVGSVKGDITNGWTADSVTAYADVSTLIDRTHAVVFHVEHFGDHSSTPIFDNILMNGRIRSNSIQTEGSAEAGQLQQVTFSIEGITAYLRRLRIPNDIVRSVASPDEWGEGIDWNPFRMAMYALWAYSTLPHLGSLGVEEGAFSAYTIAGEPRGIDGGNAIEVLTSILDPIRAAVNYAPSGELFLARNVDYKEDRSEVPLIATLTLDDLPSHTIDRDSSRTYAQVVAYGGVFDSAANTFVLYTASAPSIVYGDGGDTLEITREILTADSDADAAAEELGLRASNHYAHENPKDLLSEGVFDSWAGVMIPTNYQRWAAVLPASSNTLGRAYTATDYWLLQSVTLSLNTDGSIGVSVEKPAETSFDDAQIITDQLPDASSDMNPVLPVLPNDPFDPTDPLENYPTDLPDLEDLQPIDGESAAQSYTPWPPDTASRVAKKQGKPKCQTVVINLKQDTNTTSERVLALGTDYLFGISGVGVISTGGGIPTDYDFAVDEQTWDGAFGGGGLYATYDPGIGWGRGSFNLRIDIFKDFTGSTITDVSLTFDQAFSGELIITGVPTPSPFVRTGITWTVSGLSITDGVRFTVYDPAAGSTVPADLRLVSATVTVAGVGIITYMDAFYLWNLNGDDEQINVQAIPGDEGLFLDNTRYSPVPPFSQNHQYSGLPFTGTGNVLNGRMQLNDYSDVDDLYLYINLERKPS